MKKLRQICVLLLFLVISPISTSHAQTLLMDYSSLLTPDEAVVLRVEMDRISNLLGYSVGVVTYRFGSEYDNWVTENGEDYIVMAVCIGDRRMSVNVGGSAFYAIDDYDKDRIIGEVGPYLTAGNYSDGFYAFLTMTESYVTGVTTEKEKERQKQANLEKKVPLLQLSALVSLLMAGGVTYGFVKSMNNVNDQENAREYQGQPYISRDKEIFLYRNVVSVPRNQNTGGGGGGGRGGSVGGRGSFSSGRSGRF